MNKEELEAYNSLINGVNSAISMAIDNANYNKIKRGFVLSSGTTEGFKVKIGTQTYDNLPYLNSVSTNDTCIVVVPNNNTNDMFILGKLNY